MDQEVERTIEERTDETQNPSRELTEKEKQAREFLGKMEDFIRQGNEMYGKEFTVVVHVSIPPLVEGDNKSLSVVALSGMGNNVTVGLHKLVSKFEEQF